MKTKLLSTKWIIPLAIAVTSCAALAQGPGGPDGGGGPNGGGGPGGNGGPNGGGNRRPPRPPLPPIIRALDTNHDGVIDASEIANASAALKTLEKSGSDSLTIPDLLGPPPGGRGRGPRGPQGGPGGPNQGPGQNQGPSTSGSNNSNSQDDGPPPPPPGADNNGPGDMDGPPPAGQGGPGNHGGPDGQADQDGPGGQQHHRRVPPVIAALDTNHDGVIDSSEIANAPAALKTLDKNNTGKLTIPQLLARHPAAARPAHVREALAVKAAPMMTIIKARKTKAAPAANRTTAHRHPRPASN